MRKDECRKSEVESHLYFGLWTSDFRPPVNVQLQVVVRSIFSHFNNDGVHPVEFTLDVVEDFSI